MRRIVGSWSPRRSKDTGSLCACRGSARAGPQCLSSVTGPLNCQRSVAPYNIPRREKRAHICEHTARQRSSSGRRRSAVLSSSDLRPSLHRHSEAGLGRMLRGNTQELAVVSNRDITMRLRRRNGSSEVAHEQQRGECRSRARRGRPSLTRALHEPCLSLRAASVQPSAAAATHAPQSHFKAGTDDRVPQ